MAILTFRRIIIDLSDRPEYPIPREASFPSFTLHFINLGSHDQPAFELRQGQLPAYELAPGENAELLRLMQAITISAPRTPIFAFDGMASELLIRQHGSDMSFRWYIQRPPEWDSIGELFKYAASLSSRLVDSADLISYFLN